MEKVAKKFLKNRQKVAKMGENRQQLGKNGLQTNES